MKLRFLFLAVLTSSLGLAEELVVSGADWDWLFFKDGIGVPVDPALSDSDFHETWFLSDLTSYDGPVFSSAPGPFRMGAIGGLPGAATDLWDPNDEIVEELPPLGTRNTAYFRETFTPTEAVQTLEFSGFIDDGLVIYLDGVELTRFNVLSGEPNRWDLSSIGSNPESVVTRFFYEVSLPAGIPVTLAVSLHNQSSDNADLGFDFRVNSVSAVAPSNDDFVNALNIGTQTEFTALGTTGDGTGAIGATREVGEPDHGGNVGGGSVWFQWQAPESRRYALSLPSSEFDAIVAVYTGSAMDDLTPVSRFPRLDFPAASLESEEPFSLFARVEFDAEVGQVYYFAVDGEDGSFGNFAYRLEAFENPLDPVAILLPAESDWEHLIVIDEANQPIDPASVDGDFYTSWFDFDSYDGPSFLGPEPAPLGYVGVEASPVVSYIWPGTTSAPPANLRYTAYFRTTFTPTATVERLGFEGIIDEGAIIYINGVEVARMNVAADKDATDWQTLADGIVFGDPPRVTNKVTQHAIAEGLNLPAGEPVTIALSLHNDVETSFDFGFDLRVYALDGLFQSVDLDLELMETGAQGVYRLQWTTVLERTYEVEFSNDLLTWDSLTPDGVLGNASGVSEFTHAPESDVGFYRIVEIID